MMPRLRRSRRGAGEDRDNEEHVGYRFGPRRRSTPSTMPKRTAEELAAAKQRYVQGFSLQFNNDGRLASLIADLMEQ